MANRRCVEDVAPYGIGLLQRWTVGVSPVPTVRLLDIADRKLLPSRKRATSLKREAREGKPLPYKLIFLHCQFMRTVGAPVPTFENIKPCGKRDVEGAVPYEIGFVANKNGGDKPHRVFMIVDVSFCIRLRHDQQQLE